jgi:hypothetical protein
MKVKGNNSYNCQLFHLHSCNFQGEYIGFCGYIAQYMKKPMPPVDQGQFEMGNTKYMYNGYGL